MLLHGKRYTTPLSIAFAFVATHNHFVLDRGGKVFKQSAPVIKLPEGATEDDHLAAARRAELVDGLLLAQAEQPQQGQPVAIERGSTSRELGAISTSSPALTLQDFPLPADVAAGARASCWISWRANWMRMRLSSRARSIRLARLLDASDAQQSVERDSRARMIAVQEELDWEIYRLYGLIDEDLTYAETIRQGWRWGSGRSRSSLARAVRGWRRGDGLVRPARVDADHRDSRALAGGLPASRAAAARRDRVRSVDPACWRGRSTSGGGRTSRGRSGRSGRCGTGCSTGWRTGGSGSTRRAGRCRAASRSLPTR